MSSPDYPLPNASFDLTGHVALVTGASSGLGRRFALTLGAAGAHVVAGARRYDKLEAVADAIRDNGGRCLPVALDVTDAGQIVAALDAAEHELGPVTILVNNAGMPDAQRAHKMPVELVDRVIATNLRGPWLLATEVARRLIAAQRPGRIVNISSMGAFDYDGYGAALYSVTKAALNRMTEALAVEWARFGINVNGIAPGAFSSEMMDGMIERVGDVTRRFPRHRLGDPAQLDTTLLYLVSPASDFVTGTVVKVDDGQHPPMTDPVLIEAAINGATRKARNPHVPITEDELVADALACFDAGAAIVHHHIAATDLSGADAAEAYLGVWRRVLAERPDALWYPTINIGPPAHWYDHIGPLAESGLLRISLSDPGSVNLGGRRDGLPSGSFVYANSFDDVAHQFALCRQHRLGASIAVYEPGFLRAVLAYHTAGLLPAGCFVKLYLGSDHGLYGAPFGLPPTVTALAAYLELLGGTGLTWAVSAVGDDLGRTHVCRAALDAGGHLHVGLEFYRGDRTPTNVELVSEAADNCARAGRPVASCDEAAAILGLPRGRPGG